MTRQLERRLASLSEEISVIRAELHVVSEQLVFQQDVLEDKRVRALVAETPLADRELRIASEDFHRIARDKRETEERLSALRAEQDRLLSDWLEMG